MNRYFYSIVLLLFCLVGQAKKKQPNVVYILCDDLGIGDVQCYNPEKGKILTPNIDSFATQGMTFTDAHSGSSVCTPTRYGVLTGRYAWRSKLQEGVLRGGSEFESLIDPERETVAGLMQRAGYATVCLGKWHLGFQFTTPLGEKLDLGEGKNIQPAPCGSLIPDGPVNHGFDQYWGFHHSASMKTVIENNKAVAQMPTIKMLGSLHKKAAEYIHEAAKTDDPFFMYLALNSPHSPVVPSEDWQGKSGMGAYADFVMETDYAVGQVLNALKESGLDENTIVFFTSDNGCSFPVSRGKQLEKKYGHYPSADYRGGKSDIWEGGHRVPFLVRWPGHIEEGVKNEELICLTNLYATCADVTGKRVKANVAEDSFSILPLLEKETAESPYKVVVHHSIHGKFSLRKGDWKVELCPASGGWSSPTDAQAIKQNITSIQLYNMKLDVQEQHDVADQNPEVVEELIACLADVISNGRSNRGQKVLNDVEIDMFKGATID